MASYLLGQLPPRCSELVLTVPKGVLAARLGLRAESLSRALRKLRDEGIVSVTSGNLVRVPNRQTRNASSRAASFGSRETAHGR